VKNAVAFFPAQPVMKLVGMSVALVDSDVILVDAAGLFEMMAQAAFVMPNDVAAQNDAVAASVLIDQP
jgi:hypothetical protein